MLQGRKQRVIFIALVVMLLVAAAVPIVRSKQWSESPKPAAAKVQPAKPDGIAKLPVPTPSPRRPQSPTPPRSSTPTQNQTTIPQKPSKLSNVGPGDTLSLFIFVTVLGAVTAQAYNIYKIRLNTSI